MRPFPPDFLRKTRHLIKKTHGNSPYNLQSSAVGPSNVLFFIRAQKAGHTCRPGHEEGESAIPMGVLLFCSF